jgi:hypothetical protein
LMLLFPTGRPISRRWGWLVWVGVGLLLFLLLLATFVTPMQPAGGGAADWSYPNPIGLIQNTGLNESAVFSFFFAMMPLWVVLCLAALVVRYRRAGRVERQQMKWLLVATAVFAAAYIPVFVLTDFAFGPDTALWSNLWMIVMPLIPVSIGIAILRYRLFDIDLIIRRTLLYTATTALLALVFFGSVVLLQGVFVAVTGQQSQLAIVLSTLAIAALFNPLRNRIQAAIDRRFYRQKYDAQQVLAEFAITARDETDMNALTAELARVVQETMAPEQVSVWLKLAKGDRPFS